MQHNFFLYISLSLFCTTTTWNFQKLPSNAFYGANVVCVPVPFFFSLPLMTIFTSVAASIHHFLTASIKISYFPTPNEIGLLFFLTLSLAFSLLSTSMKTLKFNRKKESSLLTLLFILSKDQGGHAETRGRCLKCKISPRLTRGGWVTYGRTYRLYIKNDISAPDQLQGLLFW